MRNSLIFITFLICLLTTSCSRVPKHILSENKMRSIIYDMQLAEAIVETEPEIYRTSDERQLIYDAVFAKHKITQNLYDSSLIWYGQNMDLYMRINKLVVKDIEQRIEALGDIQPDPLSGEVSARDSIDIWIFDRNFSLTPEKTFNTLTFNISPLKPYSSGSSYIFSVNVWGVSPSMKHKPVISIRAVQDDTIISVNTQITGDGYYEAILRTVATKQVKRLYGYMTVNDADNFYHKIYFDDIRLMKYNYGSKALTAPTALSQDSIATEIDNSESDKPEVPEPPTASSTTVSSEKPLPEKPVNDKKPARTIKSGNNTMRIQRPAEADSIHLPPF